MAKGSSTASRRPNVVKRDRVTEKSVSLRSSWPSKGIRTRFDDSKLTWESSGEVHPTLKTMATMKPRRQQQVRRRRRRALRLRLNSPAKKSRMPRNGTMSGRKPDVELSVPRRCSKRRKLHTRRLSKRSAIQRTRRNSSIASPPRLTRSSLRRTSLLNDSRTRWGGRRQPRKKLPTPDNHRRPH